MRSYADSRFRARRLASDHAGLSLPVIALLYQPEAGGGHAGTTARSVNVGTGLRSDGTRSASPPSVLSSQPYDTRLGGAVRHLRERRDPDHTDRPAGSGARSDQGDARHRRADRHRRTSAAARGEGRPDPPAGDTARAFPAPDRAAARSVRDLRPAPGERLPEARAA